MAEKFVVGEMVLLETNYDPCRAERSLWCHVLSTAIQEALGGGLKVHVSSNRKIYYNTKDCNENISLSARAWLRGSCMEGGVDVFQVLEWLELEYDSVITPVFNAIKEGRQQPLLDRVTSRKTLKINSCKDFGEKENG